LTLPIILKGLFFDYKRDCESVTNPRAKVAKLSIGLFLPAFYMKSIGTVWA